jgi:N-acetylmuramoyl-L-alanine amidase
VILDAGHGIDTPGKRSPVWSNGTQLFEWKFNRNIVDYIIGYLQVANISYVKLIEESQDISLKERVDRINTIYKENKDKYKVYLISIHGNAADNAPTANGIEVFTSIRETKSDTIAEVFYSKLKNLGWKMRHNRSNKGGKEENFYILKNSHCPAVLTENGFYTNEEECKKMLEFYWQKQIALAHYKAIQDIEFKDLL